jgi:trk system potassium uptake protein TrkA
MRIIIAGCGRVGSLLAKKLYKENHEVIVIDKNPEVFARLGEEYQGGIVEGDCLDEDVLREVGIDKAHGVVAATDNDNTNIMLTQLAKEKYHVDKAIARIDEPSLSKVYDEEIGIITICVTEIVAENIIKLLMK